MEILVAIIALLAGALFITNNQKKKAEADKKLAATKITDAALLREKEEVDKAVKALEENIERVRKERSEELKRREEKNMTLAERRDRIRKNLKK